MQRQEKSGIKLSLVSWEAARLYLCGFSFEGAQQCPHCTQHIIHYELIMVLGVKQACRGPPEPGA